MKRVLHYLLWLILDLNIYGYLTFALSTSMRIHLFSLSISLRLISAAFYSLCYHFYYSAIFFLLLVVAFPHKHIRLLASNVPFSNASGKNEECVHIKKRCIRDQRIASKTVNWSLRRILIKINVQRHHRERHKVDALDIHTAANVMLCLLCVYKPLRAKWRWESVNFGNWKR